MSYTHYISTTTTVMRGPIYILELNVQAEVEVYEGTSFKVLAVYDEAGATLLGRHGLGDRLFAVLKEGLNKLDISEKVRALYVWAYDDETGNMICKGLA